MRQPVIRWTIAAVILLAFGGFPACGQSKRPPESAQQKACDRAGKQYFDSLHLKGGSLFGTHYDPLSQSCQAEYVVIADGLTRLSIDNATKREVLARYEASEKSGKVLKCYVLSTQCHSEGTFLSLSAKVLRWVTF